MKRTLAILLSVVLVLGLVAGCAKTPAAPAAVPDTPEAPAAPEEAPVADAPADDTVYNITVELNYPEPAATAVTAYFQKLTEASNGRLQFDIYYGYSLNGAAGLLDAIEGGIVQCAGMMPYEYPNMFPYSGSVFNLPFLGFRDMAGATQIWYNMYESSDLMKAEYERVGLTVVAAMANPIYDLHLRDAKKEVRVPADLKGMTLVATVPEIQKIVANAGGAPVYMGPPDYYATIEKGVAEGIIQHINILTSFGVNPDLVGQHIRFEQGGGGFVTSILNIVWNTEYLHSLPQDLQDLILSYNDDLAKAMLENDNGLVAINYQKSEEAGNKMVYLTDEEVLAWQEAAEPVNQESLQGYLDNGATEIFSFYEQLKAAIAAYYGE